MVRTPLRVLVTRAAEQAGNLTARLRELGCDVVEVPLISVVDPLDGGVELRTTMTEAGSPDSPYEWVVLTSPNAAARALPLLSRTSTIRVAAIGPGTADVCRANGFDVALLPHRAVGEGLVESFPDTAATEARRAVLLPRAEGAREVVADGLRSKGWRVDIVTAYRTIPRSPTDHERERARLADVVLCASSSAARSMVDAFGLEGLPERIVSIGPQTTQTLEALGAAVFATAEPHTLDGLVACVRELLQP